MKHLQNSMTMALAVMCSLKLVAGNQACFQPATPSCLYGSLTQPYYPPNAVCQDYMIPVDIEYTNVAFNATRWGDDYGLNNFLDVLTTRAGVYDSPPVGLASPSTQTATVNIAATFCTPKNKNGKEKTVILATHGIGPARAHWNAPVQPDSYNFVQYAIGQGYSVFFYDRLGTGASDKVSGFDNSIFKAISVLQSISKLVRNGLYTGRLGKPNKIAVIGFSFGSYTTHGAIAMDPSIADAVILTGMGFNLTGINVNGLLRSFVPRVASLQNSALYGDRDPGYVTWVDKYTQIWNYFKYPNYDPVIADYAETAKQPYAITEFLSLLSGPTDASAFKGPVLAITGEYDYIFCDGYCRGLLEEPGRTYYKNAKYVPYIHPGASHQLFLHYNATGAFQVITNFLNENGL
ncbi:Alpha/Beta hydrolase protein [Lipomyces doorenjongii]|uniref:Alpha/Beta hydrolase protein n=1 Tax=Lipomyces doorenjongii TaxID=383834 RepID=UPI0034CD827A